MYVHIYILYKYPTHIRIGIIIQTLSESIFSGYKNKNLVSDIYSYPNVNPKKNIWIRVWFIRQYPIRFSPLVWTRRNQYSSTPLSPLLLARSILALIFGGKPFASSIRSIDRSLPSPPSPLTRFDLCSTPSPYRSGNRAIWWCVCNFSVHVCVSLIRVCIKY